MREAVHVACRVFCRVVIMLVGAMSCVIKSMELLMLVRMVGHAQIVRAPRHDAATQRGIPVSS